MATIVAEARNLRASKAQREISVVPLNPVLGAEVGNVDLSSQFADEEIAEIRKLLLRYKVLVFRNQDITPAQHVAFAARFGELEVHPVFEHHPEHPELVMLRATPDKPARENVFHSDTTFRERPAMGSVLRCVVCPEVGGDTIWCDMALAYRQLPDRIKDVVAGLTAIHDVLPSFSGRLSQEKKNQIRADLPTVEHPMVRTHPETGEKILFVNQAFTTHITDYNEVFDSPIGRERKLDVDNLLLYLARQAEIPEYQVRVRWAPGTVVFWDNRSTQHYAVQDYFPAPRHMQRATIIGDRPV